MTETTKTEITYKKLKELLEKYNSEHNVNYYLESILYMYNGKEEHSFYGIPASNKAVLWTPAYAEQKDSDFYIRDELNNNDLFVVCNVKPARSLNKYGRYDYGICMLDSTQLCGLLSQITPAPTDAKPMAYDVWQVMVQGEEIPRIYKIVNLQSCKSIVDYFIDDCMLAVNWPDELDPRAYLKECVYDTLAYDAAKDMYYDYLYERAPLDSKYKTKLVERLVEYGILSKDKLEKEDSGKLVYRELDIDYENNLSYDKIHEYIKELADYYVFEYGSAKRFILEHFTNKVPELDRDGNFVRKFDIEEFTNFIYYRDVKLTDKYFDMNKFRTDLSIKILSREYMKMDEPILFGNGFVAFRQE